MYCLNQEFRAREESDFSASTGREYILHATFILTVSRVHA